VEGFRIDLKTFLGNTPKHSESKYQAGFGMIISGQNPQTFMEKKHEEFLPLLIKRSTLRSRIDGRGNDWNHCNSYLMVSTVAFVVLK